MPERRVDEQRRSLHCATCGAGNRLDAAALEHGWFRCAWCRSPEPVQGVGDFAIQGPAGRVTRVARPGSSEFETDSNLLVTAPRGLLVVALADLAVGGAIHALERVDPVAAGVAAPLLIGALALAAVGVLLAVGTRQRLAVTDGRVDLWWVTLGRAWNHREIRTERFHTSAYVTRRTGVEIRAPGERLFVDMRGHESIRWLEREIVTAVVDARNPRSGERVRCPGCGGPVADEKELRDAGGIECPHCETGLVQTAGGIAMPPAKIGHELEVDGEAPTPVCRRHGDVQEWTTEPWRHFHPVAAPMNVALCILFDLAILGGGAWAVWAVPAFKVVVAGAAFAAACAAFVSSGSFYRNVFGRHSFRLGPLFLDHEVRIGPWRCRHHRIPLSRLIALNARRMTVRYDGQDYPRLGVEVEAKLATHTLVMEPYGAHQPAVVRDVIEAVPARLAALGRAVETRL